jgi:adenosylcobinamide kinase / adenosylcobinamide-phosphate guanylyltransferase
MPYVMLLGGARSGKSEFAIELATRSGSEVTLIATAEAFDDEMAERIARHRAQRPAGWSTIEEPVSLVEAARAATGGDFLIIDCLTLWVSNLIQRGEGESGIVETAAILARTLASRDGGAVVVSNEVGLAVVPANALARRFRDTLGRVNTTIAAAADRSVFMVAGRIHELTSTASFLEGIPWLAPRPSLT